MRNILQLIYLLIFIILLSCNDSKSGNLLIHKKDNSHELFIKDSISIPIGNDELNFSRFTQIDDTGQSTILYRSQHMENSIDVYDWNKKSKIKRISFKKEGPYGINLNKFDMIQHVNEDSFFIGSFTGKISLSIKDSVVFQKRLFDEQNGTKFSGNYFIQVTNMRPSFIIDSTLYCGLGAFDSGKIWSNDFYRSKLLMHYNLKTNTFGKFNLSFPESFYGKCWGSSRYSLMSYTLNDKNQIVCLFPTEPRLHIFDIKKEKIVSSIKIKSLYSTPVNEISCSATSSALKKEHYLRNNSFSSWIRYDKYKSVYYMLIRLPFNSKDMDVKLLRDTYTIAPFSLIVLDNNFNILSEKKFSGRKFDFYDFFITKEGLWISNNTPYSPIFDENKIKFTLFNF